MARKRSISTAIFVCLLFLVAFGVLAPAIAPLPSLSSRSSHSHLKKKVDDRKFKIADDMFWKDGEPFRIVGGDLHYFRIIPEVLFSSWLMCCRPDRLDCKILVGMDMAYCSYISCVVCHRSTATYTAAYLTGILALRNLD
ncbi:unnamed protein product [Ilex paraguariensis]|uniref:Beta-galactosidase n=1 Tax=Ilex paraguariensis TaxID=185542 RepID=A0ABC8UG81_9AQUA